MRSPCECYLYSYDFEGYVECYLRNKVFKMTTRDEHGYDMAANNLSGIHYYLIEVKCRPSAGLSGFQA